jgi:CheY-like chemotaxis protein
MKRHDVALNHQGGNRPPMDVLIVEDSLEIAEILHEVLEMEGYASAHARHGSDALAWLAAHPAPRLLLVDLAMPEMDGPTFIARVQAHPALQAIPIIVMTAERDPAAKLRGLLVRAVLAKPFPIETLLHHLGTLAIQPAA